MYYSLSALLLFEASQAISLTWLQAGLGLLFSVVMIAGTLFQINRANKNDLKDKLVKKLDVTEFKDNCKLQDEKMLNLGSQLAKHEKVDTERHNDLKGMVAESRTDIKEILKRLPK